MLNKKAQVGEGITWIFTTIVIIVFLVAAVLITDKLVEVKGWATKAREIFSLKEQTEKIDKDFIFSKSVSSFLLVKSSDSEKLFGLKPRIISSGIVEVSEFIFGNLDPVHLGPIGNLISVLINEEAGVFSGPQSENLPLKNLENLFSTIKSQANLGGIGEKL